MEFLDLVTETWTLREKRLNYKLAVGYSVQYMDKLLYVSGAHVNMIVHKSFCFIFVSI